MTPYRLAILNLFRRPLSTWIAIAGIAAATAASGILLKINVLYQSRFKTLAHEGESIVGAKAGGLDILLGSLNLEGPMPNFLPYSLFASLEQHRAVKFEDGSESGPSSVLGAVPFLWFGQIDQFRVIGTSDEFIHRPRSSDSPELAAGRWFSASGQIVAGARAAEVEAFKPGARVRVDTVGGRLRQSADMTVSGVLKPTGKIWDYAFFASVDDGQRALAASDISARSIWGQHVLHYFLLYHEPAAFAPLQSLIDQRTIGQLVSIDREIEHLETLTGTGRAFGILLTMLTLFLSSASVAGMMVTRFDSMSVQLAILRAIGYTRGEIAQWLLWEGLLLGAIACAIGAVIDFAFFPWVRSLSGLDLPAYVPSPTWDSAIVWAAAIAVTMAAVALPLLRLYRQDVNASLKA